MNIFMMPGVAGLRDAGPRPFLPEHKMVHKYHDVRSSAMHHMMSTTVVK